MNKTLSLFVILVGILLFAATQASAGAISAEIYFANYGDSFYGGSGVSSVTASKTTVSGYSEGGADFFGAPSVSVSVQTNPGNYGIIAVAGLTDHLTFNVLGGGSALVNVRMSGNWGGTGQKQVEFGLGLGSTYYSGGAYGCDSSIGRCYGFGQGTFDTNTWYFDVPWTIYDDATYQFGYSVKAIAEYGGSAYMDDPLIIELPDGVTFTSASGSTYSPDTPSTPVPEPGTMLLVGSGLAGLVLFRKNRKK
ncbi:MAG: PEP-CTERM sorting domain-containing protein [Nitrospirota bacterium]